MLKASLVPGIAIGAVTGGTIGGLTISEIIVAKDIGEILWNRYLSIVQSHDNGILGLTDQCI